MLTGTYNYRLQSLRRLPSDHIIELLGIPCDDALNFCAGQYVELIGPEGTRHPLTIANAARADGSLAFYIADRPNDPATQGLLADIKQTGQFRCHGPLGTACYSEQVGLLPVIAVSRTGIVQAKAWLERAIQSNDQRPWLLVWQIRQPVDLFCNDWLVSWQQELPLLQVVTTLVPPAHADWSGVEGSAVDWLLAQSLEWNKVQLYTSGSWGFTDSLLAALQPIGLPQSQCISDRFAFL